VEWLAESRSATRFRSPDTLAPSRADQTIEGIARKANRLLDANTRVGMSGSFGSPAWPTCGSMLICAVEAGKAGGSRCRRGATR
jgi:hypothetical protein